MTLFKIKRTATGSWEVVPSKWGKKFIHVDFTTVGRTNRNCGGTVTPYGSILTAEEYPMPSNAALNAGGMGFSDTSDFTIPAGNGIYSGRVLKRYQQMGWIVEVDPSSAKATKKFYAMGNFSHEDIVCMNDGVTVYLTEDNSPSCLYKFVGDEVHNYTSGQLYVYKQSADGEGGSWLALPMELDSLLNIQAIAFRHGATLFTRLEGICKNAGETKLYFAETGSDHCDYRYAMQAGGAMAFQNVYLDTLAGAVKDSILQDYYGRLWVFDVAENTCRVLLAGGTAQDGKTNFANPDNICTVQYAEGKEFLFVQEDLNGISFGRQPAYITDGTQVVSEMYCLDLSKTVQSLDSIYRFALGPQGSELSGVSFSEDGNVLFLNIMHPNAANPAPYNNAVTLAVSGLREFLLNAVSTVTQHSAEAPFYIFPNPADKRVHFSKIANINVFTTAGDLIIAKQQVLTLDVNTLPTGMYFIKTDYGDLYKLVIQ